MDIELEDGTKISGLPDDMDPAMVEQIVMQGGEAIAESIGFIDLPTRSAPDDGGWTAPGERLPFTELMQRGGGVNPAKRWAHSLPEIGGAALGGGLLNAASKVPSLLNASPAMAKILGYIGDALVSPKGYGQAATGGAIEGAITAASDKDASIDSVAKGAALGSVAGTAGQRVFGNLGGVKMDPRAERLVDRGVDVTTGGRLGLGARSVEDKAMSIPYLGDSIIQARKREKDSFNRVLVNDALASNVPKPPPGTLVPEGRAIPTREIPPDVEAGAEAIKYADNQISKGYEDTLDSIVVKSDDQFKEDITNLQTMIRELPPEIQKRTMRIIDRNITGPTDNPNELLLGRTFKKSYSDLRRNEGELNKSQDIWAKDSGKAIGEVKEALKRLNARQNPEQAATLAGLDKSFAKMKVVKKAAKLRGADDQMITPAQYLGEVNSASTGDKFVHGDAFNQELAGDAKAVMGMKVPDSGTSGRAALMASALGGSAVTGSFVPTMTGLLTGAAAYTKPGQKALNKLLFERERNNLLRGGAEGLTGLAAANAAVGLMD